MPIYIVLFFVVPIIIKISLLAWNSSNLKYIYIFVNKSRYNYYFLPYYLF